MNEELLMQHAAEQQMKPPKKERKALKRILFVIVSLLLIGGLGYGGALAWKEYSNTKTTLASEQDKNQKLTVSNQQLQKDLSAATGQQMISDTLPGGQTITYPDTVGNRNVLWWSTGNATSDMNSFMISHKAYQQYMAASNSTLTTAMCGTDTNIKAVRTNIIYGLVDIKTKQVGAPQNEDCVTMMASAANTDATSRQAAQKVLDKIKQDITAFLASVTIK